MRATEKKYKYDYLNKSKAINEIYKANNIKVELWYDNISLQISGNMTYKEFETGLN